MKLLTLSDINDYIDDKQDVQIIAYNIKLYDGPCGSIPMKYSKYELVPQKMRINRDNKLVIELDC